MIRNQRHDLDHDPRDGQKLAADFCEGEIVWRVRNHKNYRSRYSSTTGSGDRQIGPDKDIEHANNCLMMNENSSIYIYIYIYIYISTKKASRFTYHIQIPWDNAVLFIFSSSHYNERDPVSRIEVKINLSIIMYIPFFIEHWRSSVGVKSGRT